MALSIDSLSNIGLTQSQLVSIRENALAQVLAGEIKQTTSLSVPGLSSTFSIVATPLEIARAATYALQKLLPEVYGLPKRTRTVARMR